MFPTCPDEAGRGALAPKAAGVQVENPFVTIAREFSPRYTLHHDDLVLIDVSGLERLLGTPRTIGEELRREASARGARAHVAVASTQIAALVLAHARPGLTVVDPGAEAAALAPVPVVILEHAGIVRFKSGLDDQASHLEREAPNVVSVLERWGVTTLGDLAALPSADLSARLGVEGLFWQAVARGEDMRPFVPDVPEERFESSLDLEWPIEGLEPLSFVLTRLLEPLSMRLERRDRGVAVLGVRLRLVTSESFSRRLELPSPMRDVRTLRTLALLDLESHPPPAAIDRVTVAIDPTPGRVLQHRLFDRAHSTPEQLSTLLARLGALMGQDRIGAPASVDSYRPGAFEMRPFATDHERGDRRSGLRSERDSAGSARALEKWRRSETGLPGELSGQGAASVAASPVVVSALRRCRQPVPARVAVEACRPVRVTTDRRSYVGGTVIQASGPWRTSGEWWNASGHKPRGSTPTLRHSEQGSTISGRRREPAAASWDRDEWDVALSDGAVYRIFRDRETDGWFIDAIVD